MYTPRFHPVLSGFSWLPKPLPGQVDLEDRQGKYSVCLWARRSWNLGIYWDIMAFNEGFKRLVYDGIPPIMLVGWAYLEFLSLLCVLYRLIYELGSRKVRWMVSWRTFSPWHRHRSPSDNIRYPRYPIHCFFFLNIFFYSTFFPKSHRWSPSSPAIHLKVSTSRRSFTSFATGCAGMIWTLFGPCSGAL